MSTINQANAYKLPSLKLSNEMLAYQSTSKLHPLASAIVYLLKEASQSVLLPLIMNSLIKVLKTYVTATSIQSNDLAPSLDGIEEFMRNVVIKSNEAWLLFVEEGINSFLSISQNCMISSQNERELYVYLIIMDH